MKTTTTTSSNSAPAEDTAPVTVTNQTVADLAKAIAASRLAPAAPAGEQNAETQDTAPEAAAEETHPSTEGEGETDLSNTQAQEAEAPATEAEGEPEATPEAEAEANAEAEEAPVQSETAEQRLARVEKALAKAQKRIGQLTAQKHAKAAEAEATPAKAAPAAEVPTPLPQQAVPKLVELDRQIARTEALESWLESDGAAGGEFTDPDTGSKYAIGPDEVDQARKIVASTKRDLVADRAVEKASAQRAWANEQAQLSAQFAKEFPAYQRTDTPERAQMDALLSHIPAELRTWGAKLLVAKAMAYDAQQRKQAAKPAAPAARSVKAGNQPPPVAMRPAAAARPAAANQTAMREAQEAYARTGSVKDLAKMRALTRAAT